MPSMLERLPLSLPRLLRLLSLVLLCAGTCWSAEVAQPETLVLVDNTTGFQVKGDILTWLDSGAQGSLATVATAVANPGNFAPTSALSYFSLGKNDALWIKLRLLRPHGSKSEWTLNIPTPSVDALALYQSDAAGNWSMQRAGDTIAQTEWQKAGLYPEFALSLPAGVPQDVLLQVRNFKPTGIPMRLFTTRHSEAQRQLELLTVALMIGSLLSLVVLSFIRYLEHRNHLDILASLFGLLITASIAQLNGVLNNFVWFATPRIGNYASGVMPMLLLGCGLLFVRNLFALATHHQGFGGFLSLLGWGAILAVLGFGLADRYVADWFISGILLLATVLGLFLATLIWRAGNPAGRWLVATMLPQCLCALWMTVESTGLIPVVWEIRYVTSLCISVAVPILLYILSQLTHDRKQLVMRANHLPTQDALTGLLTPAAFQTHLEDAVERAISRREPLSLALVRIVNHEQIRQTMGDPVAEQCLLRAVVKVQRVLRDVDPAGRVGTAQFALLMEGVATREALSERMVKLIGSGFIPLPGLEPEVTLRFQAACVMLHKNPVPANRVLNELRTMLEGMSYTTRRPIRFLEAVATQVMDHGFEAESSRVPEDTDITLAPPTGIGASTMRP